MKFEYQSIGPPIDLCILALEQCIHLGLPPSWVHTLHVGPGLLSGARGIVRHLIDGTKDNPFVPQINIVVEQEFERLEWCIESMGAAWGSNPY